MNVDGEEYTADRIRALVAERDELQHHIAYHLNDYRVNREATGDLAVDMATYANRLRAALEAEREAFKRLEEAVLAVDIPLTPEQVARIEAAR